MELHANKVDAFSADSSPRWMVCVAELLSSELLRDCGEPDGESSYEPDAELAFLRRNSRRRRSAAAFRSSVANRFVCRCACDWRMRDPPSKSSDFDLNAAKTPRPSKFTYF